MKKFKYTVSQLAELGFKRTTIKDLWVSKTGQVFNKKTGRYLKPTLRGIVVEGKQYHLAKLILEAFKVDLYRSGQIIFINGDKSDFSLSNLKYRTSVKCKKPTDVDLIKCIRCYFEVLELAPLKKDEWITQLKTIIKIRDFKKRTKKNEGSILFFDWITQAVENKSRSIYSYSLKHKIGCTTGENYINRYLGLLVSEVLQDLEAGILVQNKFKQKPPRKKSTQQLVNEYRKKQGLPIKKQITGQAKAIEYRNKIEKIRKEYKNSLLMDKVISTITKHNNHEYFFIKDGLLYEVYSTIRGARILKILEVAGMPNEKRCSKECLVFIVKEYFY